jgi:adenylate kinase family enzyme
MPNIFISADDEFEVKLAVAQAKDDSHQIVADLSGETIKETYKDAIDETTIEEHSIWFRYPSFEDQSKIIDSAVKIENDSYQINPQALRYKRITQLIKRWTFKGRDGKPTNPSAEMVKKLHPVIAMFIGMQLEAEMTKRGVF